MIVTVCNGRVEADWFDILVDEKSLAGKVLEELHNASGHHFNHLNHPYILEGRLPDQAWFEIGAHTELGLSGLQDGGFIRVQRTYSTIKEDVK
ncbi:hypothetical protein J2Z69_002047 [Paenibacillus shirakamiensis]|uniref:Uncharacterized protein n=1 Tax=Paenibacillus shirakamiensis TaxID=1265935 RepID=A0ABS4JH04_9BACL|nr:hypothetical protein [Paenibacillus shirakamiensis]MBP2001004.1 hypothetical protein [Paenibacillus shirakamiensis]